MPRGCGVGVDAHTETMGDTPDLTADGAVAEDTDPLRYKVLHGGEAGFVPGVVGALPGEENWEMVV